MTMRKQVVVPDLCFSVSKALGLAVLALVLHLANAYLRNPLRRFPAPSIAGFSSLWGAYHTWFFRRSTAVDEAHAKLGPIIRIQPTHVSFNHPEAVSTIYGHGTVMLKDEFYETFTGSEYRSIVGTRSRQDHSRKRKYIASAFAQKNIVDMEPLLREKVRFHRRPTATITATQ